MGYLAKMNTSRSSAQNESKNSEDELNELDMSEVLFDESILQLLDRPNERQVDSSNLRTDVKYKGFDSTMGKTWIYPTNYPVRQYQHHISRVSLFKNTLVVLPTGLGKTFIASVVMYNFFRWYPKGKVIFMAPTRPLVAQQIRACYQIMAFPKDETIELTGKQNKKVRAVAWHTKRVFFCTPQVVWRDICDNEMKFPINDIKLVVVDEAHKAKGKYAYTEVVQAIWEHNKLFRVLALSATPGRTMNDVSDVVKNLLISHIEVRRENSIDVVPYVFKKNIKTIVVPLSEDQKRIRQRLHELVEPYINNLEKHKVIGGHVENMTKAWLLFDRSKFRESTLSNRHPEQSSINVDFSVCISMFHAIELLERHGTRVFLNYFNDNSGSSSSAGGGCPDNNFEEKFFVMKDSKIKQFLTEVRQECQESGIVPFTDADMSFHGNISNADLEQPIDYGHPKFDILQNCLLTHFRDHSETKAIVFCEYRESVFLINRMLLTNQPLIKPKVFVGQGSSHNRTITQKEQIAIMNDFRSGKCNTLIATCVAEEGIDVGEVDFIVCFDVNNKNPIRYVQRIGRTGRKRQGQVRMLVTEGKEQQILRDIFATKDGINSRIAKSNEMNKVLYKECPRLVPPEFNPHCVETFIEVQNTQEPSTSKEKTTKEAKSKDDKKSGKINKKQLNVQKGNMRQFFKPIEIDDEMEENFDLCSMNPRNMSAENSDVNDKSMETIHENKQTEPSSHCIEHFRQANESHTDFKHVSNTATHDTHDTYDERMNLKQKLEHLYGRYRDAKKRQAKWNDLEGKVSKSSSATIDERVPSIIRDMLIQSRKESNKRHIFRTCVSSSAHRSFDEKLSIMMLMSFLQLPKEQPSHMATEKIESQPVNLFDDTQLSFSNVQAEHQSKYASQLIPISERASSSAQLFVSSTPHKILNNHQNSAVPMHSPIICTPQTNQIGKIDSQPPGQKNRINKDDPKWYLKYLGLNSISDLFSDEESDEHGNISDDKNKSDDQETKLCNNLNKSICGNDSLIEEQSQYTVSRILKICEDAERERSDKNANAELVMPRRKRLYIGSVDDLFCDDDDDDDGDDDAIINSQAIGVSLSSSSDDTVIYDVEDAMSLHKDPHQSTNLFKDTIEGETSHRFSNTVGKMVANTKSDDLFSSCNETIASVSCSKNATANNQSPLRVDDKIEDNIPKTPEKCHTSNYFAYFSQSPSVLIKASSILSANNQSRLISKMNNTTKSSNSSSNRSIKSPTSLSFKLSALNTQLSLSQHFNDFDEIKENIDTKPTPFSTCQTSRTTYRKQEQSNSPNPSIDMGFSDSDIFATCPSIPKIHKRTKKVRKRRINNFIDDEAAVSGDDESSDDDDFTATQRVLNIAEDDEDDDPSVDMQAKYLQSVRSPIGQQRFRIPRIGYRNPMATQDIFSQFVAPDQSKYEEDSFVVGSDEDVDSDCTEFLSEDELSEFDEITIAKTRPNKRKLDEIKNSEVKKRRRIIEMSSDSD